MARHLPPALRPIHEDKSMCSSSSIVAATPQTDLEQQQVTAGSAQPPDSQVSLATRIRHPGRLFTKFADTEWYQDIGTGSWTEVTWHLLTTMTTPVAFAGLPWAFAQVGWAPGLILLILLIAGSWYCAHLLAGLHTWTVTVRFCRWRDLARSVWGWPGFYLAFILQQLASLGGNMGVQLGCALVMKDIFMLLNPEKDPPSIHTWLIIFAACTLVLSQLPTVHSMRTANVGATIIATIYSFVITVACIYNGFQVQRETVSYSLAQVGSTARKTFVGFEGLGTILYAVSTIMLPEIQALTKPPAVLNGQKGVAASYVTMICWFFPLAISGYWAFGNSVAPLIFFSLPDGKTGADWYVILAELLLVLHGIFNFAVYARPTMECFEYLILDTSSSMLCPKNCIARLAYTGVYHSVLTYLICLIPAAFGLFVTCLSAFTFVPMVLIIPMLLYNTARKPARPRYWFHIFAALFWAALAVCVVIAMISGMATYQILEVWGDLSPQRLP